MRFSNLSWKLSLNQDTKSQTTEPTEMRRSKSSDNTETLSGKRRLRAGSIEQRSFWNQLLIIFCQRLCWDSLSIRAWPNRHCGLCWHRRAALTTVMTVECLNSQNRTRWKWLSTHLISLHYSVYDAQIHVPYCLGKKWLSTPSTFTGCLEFLAVLDSTWTGKATRGGICLHWLQRS